MIVVMNRQGDTVARIGSVNDPVRYLRACPDCLNLVWWIAVDGEPTSPAKHPCPGPSAA